VLPKVYARQNLDPSSLGELIDLISNIALGALAFGIGTSEVEHVLATGCLWQSRSKNLKIEVNGELDKHVSATS
jgi:hypothetical protein